MVIVFLFLGASLAVVTAVLVLAFFDVAFRESHVAKVAVCRVPGSLTADWHPPAMQGADLLNWASSTARQTALDLLAGSRDAGIAGRLAVAVETATERVIKQSPHRGHWRPHNARDCCRIVGVTAPEVIEIAEHVRSTQPFDRVAQMLGLAAANAARAADAVPQDSRQRQVRCPLLCDSGECVASSCRPISCLADCPLFGTTHTDRTSDGQRDAFAQTIGQGVGAGLSAALESAGLESRHYELNSALAVALQSPDVSQRWAAGEEVFSRCQTL